MLCLGKMVKIGKLKFLVLELIRVFKKFASKYCKTKLSIFWCTCSRGIRGSRIHSLIVSEKKNELNKYLTTYSLYIEHKNSR